MQLREAFIAEIRRKGFERREASGKWKHPSVPYRVFTREAVGLLLGHKPSPVAPRNQRPAP